MKIVRFKAVLSWALALALMVGMLGTALPVFAEETDSGVKITVVHTNDVHSRVEVESYAASIAAEKRAAGENVLLLSAGDVLHGQPLATLSRGYNIVQIMNAAGYDAMAPGNHDFNYGFDRLVTLSQQMKFPVLAANVTRKNTGEAPFAPYIIRDFDGVKVGVFGLSTPETATKTNPSNVSAIDFEFPYHAAQRTVKSLQDQGCDVIIALTHLGVDKETWEAERSTYLTRISGIDLIVDGHSHTAMGELSGGTMVVQAGGLGENVGVVELSVSGGKVQTAAADLLPVPTEEAPNPDLVPDAAVSGLIKKLTKANEKITSQVVAAVGVNLQGEREFARKEETNLGNLICDAMLSATGADLAITNGGGIRASIAKGEVTKGDVLTVLPFGNYIVTKKMTGAQVLEALELGVANYPELAGSFPQVGGIRFVFDADQPAGKRVVEAAFMDGTPIDRSAVYTVATNDFLADGGDGYDVIGGAGGSMIYSALDEALIDYLQTNPVIKAGTDGRITPAGGAKAAPEAVAA